MQKNYGCNGCAYNEKSADELFKELGYEKNKYYSTEYSEKYKKDDDNVYYFEMKYKEIIKSGEYDGMCGAITMQELQALNKKCEELGWL